MGSGAGRKRERERVVGGRSMGRALVVIMGFDHDAICIAL